MILVMSHFSVTSLLGGERLSMMAAVSSYVISFVSFAISFYLHLTSS